MSDRIGVLCPGRGSYGPAQLGYLAGLAGEARAAPLAEALAAVDDARRAAGSLPVLAMDGAAELSSRFLRGENAAPLIFSCTALDFLRIEPTRSRVVAVGGNSMGWYSALWCAGALGLAEAFELVQTMGAMTRDRPAGGQVIYPTVDESWSHDASRAASVEEALASARAAGHRAGHSIRFGGFAVLWADEEGIRHLLDRLVGVALGGREYPLRLFGNAAFHSPLMAFASSAGLDRLAALDWRAPELPLIDGRGASWRPGIADPQALVDYTLGHQVTRTFDFLATVRVMLREYAPDRLVLLGPGDSLGSAVAQVLIQERWRGIDSREAFLELQAQDPFVLSLGRPDQAARVL